MEAAFSVPVDVLASFGVDGAPIEPLTGGRTNRTLRVRAGRDLVLQQMQAGAHPDLLGIMENLVRVTAHLDWRRRFQNQGPSWYPTLVPTVDSKPFMMTADGDVWRAFAFRPGQILRSRQPLVALAEAGRIYGRFTKETADLGGPPLIETAPGFHDLATVYDSFCTDLETASDERRIPIVAVLDRVEALMGAIETCCSADGVAWSPERVVHNDTKISNVLFDVEDGSATAVLDLDLAMMGPSWHDLGDLVRSACWHSPLGAAPDFAVDLFDAVVGAFTTAAGHTLSDREIVTYAVAGPRLSFELGLRYLNDHVRAEPTLRVRGENGHLKRGLANVKLAEEMLGAYDALRHSADVFIADR